MGKKQLDRNFHNYLVQYFFTLFPRFDWKPTGFIRIKNKYKTFHANEKVPDQYNSKTILIILLWCTYTP